MQMIKKIWVLTVALFMMIFAGGWLFFLESEVNGPIPQYVFQTITADSCRSRTITWQTKVVEGMQQINYRVQPDGEEQSQEVLGIPLATGEEPMLIYTVTLTNLEPGKVYQYQVGSKNNWSDWYTFKTPSVDSNAFKTLIFGDSQSIDYSVWAQTAQGAWRRNQDAAFFINMGDLVDIGSHYPQWQAWFDGGAGMISNIPVAAISGNHENYLPGGTYTPARLYLQLFHLPDNGPTGLKQQAYSFDYGKVHFVALDSQAEELANFQPDLIAKQIKWLDNDLEQTKQPWKVVIVHRSMFKNSKEGDLNEIGKHFVPVFDKHKVDIVFTAHIHTYGRTPPLIAGKLATAKQKGTIYISTGRSGNIAGEDTVQKYFEKVFDGCLVQPNYLVLEAESDYLTITNFCQDGTFVDSVELNH